MTIAVIISSRQHRGPTCCSGRSPVISGAAFAPLLLFDGPAGTSCISALPDRISPQPRVVVSHCSILTELAKLHQPDRALATFAWFEQSPQYSVDGCLLYTRMISILGRHKRHTAHALRIFDRMQARRIQPDLMCFNAAINVAGAAQCCCCEDVGALVYTSR